MRKAKRVQKLRELAYRIIEHRNYVTFNGETPRYLFNDVHSIPWRFRRHSIWLHQYIVMPTIRERLRWESHKLTGNALPVSLRVDNRLW